MKEQARDIIKDWMPGSNAEDYITSVYCQARLPEPMYALSFEIGVCVFEILKCVINFRICAYDYFCSINLL